MRSLNHGVVSESESGGDDLVHVRSGAATPRCNYGDGDLPPADSDAEPPSPRESRGESRGARAASPLPLGALPRRRGLGSSHSLASFGGGGDDGGDGGDDGGDEYDASPRRPLPRHRSSRQPPSSAEVDDAGPAQLFDQSDKGEWWSIGGASIGADVLSFFVCGIFVWCMHDASWCTGRREIGQFLGRRGSDARRHHAS